MCVVAMQCFLYFKHQLEEQRLHLRGWVLALLHVFVQVLMHHNRVKQPNAALEKANAALGDGVGITICVFKATQAPFQSTPPNETRTKLTKTGRGGHAGALHHVALCMQQWSLPFFWGPMPQHLLTAEQPAVQPDVYPTPTCMVCAHPHQFPFLCCSRIGR